MLEAASCWVLDRLGVLASPPAGTEEWVIAYPWPVVAAFATVAVGYWPANPDPRGVRRLEDRYPLRPEDEQKMVAGVNGG